MFVDRALHYTALHCTPQLMRLRLCRSIIISWSNKCNLDSDGDAYTNKYNTRMKGSIGSDRCIVLGPMLVFFSSWFSLSRMESWSLTFFSGYRIFIGMQEYGLLELFIPSFSSPHCTQLLGYTLIHLYRVYRGLIDSLMQLLLSIR